MAGKIVTFYSYKGGTGRSMALANVAWILSANDKRVLAIDWDFEAPGLHRYFQPFLQDAELEETKGLIDLLWDYVDLTLTPQEAWPIGLDKPSDIVDSQRYAVALEFPFQSSRGCLHFLGAGKQDAKYGDLVRDFDWTAFYERLGGGECLDRLRERLQEQYDFVLIDSRTGVSDTSGICTVHMPDIVVLCFTYNLQSVRGIAAVAESITKQSSDIAFILAPMRVPLEEIAGLEEARNFARATLNKFLPIASDARAEQEYWVRSETAYRGAYAFHEVLAVFRDPLEGRNTLLRDMEWLAGEIVGEPITLRTSQLEESLRRNYILQISAPAPFSGEVKIIVCRRLVSDWQALADYLDIPLPARAHFHRGREPQGVWEWLESRGRLTEIADGLRYIGRDDLVQLLWRQPPAEPYTGYYLDCVTRWSDERYALDKRFVQLTLLLDQGEDELGPHWQSARETFHDLVEVLTRVPHQAVVLLGPPGSGKSTLLRYFELNNARAVLQGNSGDDLSPLTFFIQLYDYKPTLPATPLPPPKDWLAQQWATRYPDLPALDTLLQQRRLTLLLDALNEIPYAGSEPVQLWKEFLRELAHDHPGNRVIFSCRSLDYSATLSSTELPVPQVHIEPLSNVQMQDFIARYFPEHGAALWQNLQGTLQLDVLRSPYYLKLLVAQTIAREIPVGRAALFTGFVRHALRREVESDNTLFQADALLHARDVQRLVQMRTWPLFELPENGILFQKLSALAFQMQMRRAVNEATQVRIAYNEALAMLDHPRAEDILKAGAALGVLDEDRGRDEVLYVNRLIQEYFAARHLARQPQEELVRQEWHADRVVPGLQDTLDALADSDPLPPLPSTGWEETMVLATAMSSDPEHFVTDLMEENLPVAGRCAAQPEVTISEGCKERLRCAMVVRTQDPAADLRVRIAAGLALGDLGDPRFERRRGPHGDYLLPPLIEIPAGTYHIGSDEESNKEAGPICWVRLAAFAIGQFPVTNAEWTLFMQARGYEEERWWETEEAQAWRRGEGTAEGPKQAQRDARKYWQDNFDRMSSWHREGRITSKQVEYWEPIVRMSDDAFETLLTEWYPTGRQSQPAYWNDESCNHLSQPVVGICWFEARAYCAWLSAQTGQPFRLPTEVEWEAAARGQQRRRYAFGNDFEAAHGNTSETHIRRTTPIGVFPGGATPEGIVDMTGNTLDWTSSEYRPYPYKAADGREDPHTRQARRVSRGGSWHLSKDRARACARADCVAGNRHYSTGLRVALSSG